MTTRPALLPPPSAEAGRVSIPMLALVCLAGLPDWAIGRVAPAPASTSVDATTVPPPARNR